MANRIPGRVLALCAALVLGLAGCNSPRTTTHRSSLMAYLYPKNTTAPVPTPAFARLKLPLKLGIVFVPGSSNSWRNETMLAPGSERPLLDIVKGSFRDKPWVEDIKIIPSSYLMLGGGFDNMTAVARMYGVDVMALVSVDQVQYTDPKWYSFAYLSIIGAYVLPGDANDTRTLIDAAVYDVGTRAFLLRAPGQSVVKGSSSWANHDVRLRESSAKGLTLAMEQLAKNLDVEVAAFKAEIASGARKDVDVVDRQGQSLRATGGRNFGGAWSGLELLAVYGLAALAWLWKRRT